MSLTTPPDLLDKATKRSLYLGLVDIIFAYAYNYRSTEGEGTVSVLERQWFGMSTVEALSLVVGWIHLQFQVRGTYKQTSLNSKMCNSNFEKNILDDLMLEHMLIVKVHLCLRTSCTVITGALEHAYGNLWLVCAM